jgi:hypothetical protein
VGAHQTFDQMKKRKIITIINHLCLVIWVLLLPLMTQTASLWIGGLLMLVYLASATPDWTMQSKDRLIGIIGFIVAACIAFAIETLGFGHIFLPFAWIFIYLMLLDIRNIRRIEQDGTSNGG